MRMKTGLLGMLLCLVACASMGVVVNPTYFSSVHVGGGVGDTGPNPGGATVDANGNIDADGNITTGGALGADDLTLSGDLDVAGTSTLGVVDAAGPTTLAVPVTVVDNLTDENPLVQIVENEDVSGSGMIAISEGAVYSGSDAGVAGIGILGDPSDQTANRKPRIWMGDPEGTLFQVVADIASGVLDLLFDKDDGDAEIEISNPDGTYEANLTVEGDLSTGGVVAVHTGGDGSSPLEIIGSASVTSFAADTPTPSFFFGNLDGEGGATISGPQAISMLARSTGLCLLTTSYPGAAPDGREQSSFAVNTGASAGIYLFDDDTEAEFSVANSGGAGLRAIISGTTESDDLEIGGAYAGGTGATISSAGVGQFNGALTTDGALTALSGSFGGGYGSTGASISSAGVGQFNGALTTDAALTSDSATIGGGYGSSGVTISNAGNIQANGTLAVDSTSTLSGVVSTVGLQSTSSTFDVKGLGSTRIGIDSNNDSSGATFTIRANDTTDVVTVTEAGNTTIAGTLTATGQIFASSTIAAVGDIATFGGLSGANLTNNGKRIHTSQSVTLASDAFTATKSFVKITSQTGTSDNLSTINGGTAGEQIIIRPVSGHTITVQHNTGNIICIGAANMVLSPYEHAVLFFDDNSKWYVLSNGA